MELETYGWRVMQLGFKWSLQVISFRFLVVFSLCLIWNTTRKPSSQAWLTCSFAFPLSGSFALHLLSSHQCSAVEAGWGLFESFHTRGTGCQHHWPQEMWTDELKAATTQTKKTTQNPASVSSVAVFVIGNPVIIFPHLIETQTLTWFDFSFILEPIKERASRGS